MSGIDPRTGEGFRDGEAEAQQQHYSAMLSEHDRQLRAVEAELAAATNEFEAARQLEVTDVAGAQQALERAHADLVRTRQGASADELAQARGELAGSPGCVPVVAGSSR